MAVRHAQHAEAVVADGVEADAVRVVASLAERCRAHVPEGHAAVLAHLEQQLRLDFVVVPGAHVALDGELVGNE